MDQTVNDDSLDSEEIIDHDEEIDEEIDYEEQLEKDYGGLDDSMDEKRGKAMGTGFSKQKQVMEENKYYQGSGKKKEVRFKKGS
jgi:hypothetical protein